MKPLSDEQRRIMLAAGTYRLGFDSCSYRYYIDDEDPPDRKEREKLQKRGLLSRPRTNAPILTDRGLAVAERLLSGEPEVELAPEQTTLRPIGEGG